MTAQNSTDQPSELHTQDHADLLAAAGLINGVMDRNGGNLTGPALTAFCQAIFDIRIGEQYLEVSGA